MNDYESISATFLPVSWPHPLSQANELAPYELLNIQAEYIQYGKYDKNLLYDTAPLLYFKDTHASNNAKILVDCNVEKVVKVTLKIPSDFPNDLISKPIFSELLCRVESLGIEACLTICAIVMG